LIGVIPNCPGERQVLLALPDGAPSEVASHASDKRLAAFCDADNQEIRRDGFCEALNPSLQSVA
jgi:hypothetical protein